MNPETPSPSRFPVFGRLMHFFFGRKMLLVLAALVTVVALLYAIENFRGARAWAAYERDAKARGVKLEFTELIPPPVPESENAANTPLVQEWFGGTDAAAWPKLLSEAEARIKKRSRSTGKHPTDLVAWAAALDAEGKKTVATFSDREATENAAAAPAVLKALEPYAAALLELHTASQKPKVRYPINYNTEQPFAILLPHLTKIREVAKVLQLRASVHLAAGNTDAALNDVMLLLWLTESLKEENLLINQLVRIALLNIAVQPIWEGIHQHRWSEAQLAQLQQRLSTIDFVSNFENAMNMERAAGVTTIEWIRKTGRLNEMLPVEPGSPNPNRRWIYRSIMPSGWFQMEAANYASVMDALSTNVVNREKRTIDAAVVEANDVALQEKFKEIGIGVITKHHFFARLLVPALGKASRRFANGQATAHQAAIACALERHRLATGKLPESLDALVPKYFTQLPHDPLNGDPMRYDRLSDTDYALASVGWPDLAPGKSNMRSDQLKQERSRWIWRSAPGEPLASAE